jgi:glycolate oxidase FAD binding subunit
VASLLRQASDAAAPVIPLGGGTRLGLGEPPRAAQLLLSLENLNRVVEYDADNLTLTVEAGVRLAEIERLTRERRLFLPLDVPRPEEATAGGLAATAASGPRRARYGAPRNLALGMRVALVSGEVIRAGGKTVKNVAGYDMTKLFLGSLGTLGVIVEITFRLRPRPEVSESQLLPFDSATAAGDLSARLLASPFAPAAVELVEKSAAAAAPKGELPEAEWLLVVALEGETETVARQRKELRALAPRGVALPGDAAGRLWRGLSELTVPAGEEVVLRASLPLAEASGFAAEAVAEAGERAIRAGCLAHLGHGAVYLRLCCEPEKAVSFGRLIRQRISRLGGHLIVEGAPPEVKSALGVWGPEPPSFGVMRRLKSRFDPAGILNPGRFLGGI